MSKSLFQKNLIVVLILFMSGSVNAAILTVDDSGGADYAVIQDAINAANQGDTIEVNRGFYYENVNVNKELTLRGIGMPVVDGRLSGNAFTISSSGVTLEAFDVSNSSEAGIRVNSNNNVIRNNSVSNNQNGIELASSAYNTISNNNVSLNKGVGIPLYDNSSFNIISGNIASSNGNKGIAIDESYWNTISDNTVNSNGREGIHFSYSDFNLIITNIVNSNSGTGILLQYSDNNNITENNVLNSFDYPEGYHSNGIGIDNSSGNNVSNNIAVSNTDTGISLSSSNNNNIYDNNASLNSINGISLYTFSKNNTLNSNIASYNKCGIDLSYESDYNTLINNTANFNNQWEGIFIKTSSYNILSENTVNNNNLNGIGLMAGSNYNSILNNNINSNMEEGIRIDSSSDNIIHNNIFNNSNNVGFAGININTWNITKQSGTNIIGGSYIGGNFWANPSGTGFSQTCTYANNDGICDTPYSLDSYNFDYLPLAMPQEIANGIITGTVTNITSGSAIYGATVAAGIVSTTTSPEGSYSISIAPGTYSLTASASGFISSTSDVTVVSGETVTQNFALQPIGVNLVDSYLPPGGTPAERKEGLIRAMDDYFDNGLLTKPELLSVLDAYFA